MDGKGGEGLIVMTTAGEGKGGSGVLEVVGVGVETSEGAPRLIVVKHRLLLVLLLRWRVAGASRPRLDEEEED